MSATARLPAETRPRPDLRILILNWRCPTNPRAGGAEAFTFEVARRLVEKGDTVEWFSAKYPGAPDEEVLHGVRLIRAGRQWTVHWAAFRRYRRRLRETFDVVVDEVNTIPFFTPLWSDVPTVMLIHQLAREVWWYESPFPVNALGFMAEPFYLACYRRVPVLTVSPSTKRDLERLGFTGAITLVPEGIEPTAKMPEVKPAEPTFLYVGRLAPSKRIDHILRAFGRFRTMTGTGTLRLVGAGPDRHVESLKRLAERLGISSHVMFTGRVTMSDKQAMMGQAHALLMTSVREGWGLVVTEAGAHGTPAIVYDVPGLRDSVRDESTGLVVQPFPKNLSDAMLRITRDTALHSRLSAESRRWSETFTFAKTTEVVHETLKSLVAVLPAGESDAERHEAAPPGAQH